MRGGRGLADAGAAAPTATARPARSNSPERAMLSEMPPQACRLLGGQIMQGSGQASPNPRACLPQPGLRPPATPPMRC